MTHQSNETCNLCFELICGNDYKIVDLFDQEIFEVLKIDVDIKCKEKFTVCTNCLNKLQKCFEFKRTCLYVEDYITPWIENEVQVDLKEIFQKKVKISKDVSLENYQICRLCMGLIENKGSKYINGLKNDNLRKQLKNCLPEMNLRSTFDPLICETCMSSLQHYNDFRKACLNEVCLELEDNDDFRNSSSKLEVEENFEDYKILLDEINVTNNAVSDVNLDDLQSSGQQLNLANENATQTKDKVKKTCIYNCKLCLFSTDFPSILKAHELRAHRNPPLYMCDLCNVIFESKESSKKHCQVHRGVSKRFGCKVCDYETDFKQGLHNHLRHHMDPSELRTYSCDVCKYSTKIKNVLALHKKFKHSGDVTYYKCHECDFMTVHKGSLKSHVQLHQNYDRHQCPHCDFKTRLKSNLLAHLPRHKSPRFKCEQCDFMGHTKRQVKVHMYKHLSPDQWKMHSCKLCSYSSRFGMNLNRHMLVHKGPDERVLFKCPKCDYKAKTKISITQHLQVSHKDPRDVVMHKCDECTHVTKNKNYLLRHKLAHRNKYEMDKVYKCANCPYLGKTTSHLKRHELVHKKPDETKMYKCDKCPFETKHKMSLVSHQFVHNPAEKSFKCHLCDYKSQFKTNLTQHAITHKKFGETPAYECATCDFKTKYKYNLKDHTKSCRRKKKRKTSKK